MTWSAFQFTRPRGARLYLPQNQFGRPSFNSRAHGGRDTWTAGRRASGKSFNSRAHGGRDPQSPVVANELQGVSIHAPTGGATSISHFTPVITNVSIHAPTGGATRRAQSAADTVRVSIHAPTGGATPSPHRNRHPRSFNSRAHGGRDSVWQIYDDWCQGFQFTRPRGARHRGVASPVGRAVSIHAPTGGATCHAQSHSPGWTSFNSRAHGGRDDPQLADGLRTTVSIHAPTGGATQRPSLTLVTTAFQFTRPRGARPRHAGGAGVRRGFNSRAHGGRDFVVCETRGFGWFQFTRPRGARHVAIMII